MTQGEDIKLGPALQVICDRRVGVYTTLMLQYHQLIEESKAGKVIEGQEVEEIQRYYSEEINICCTLRDTVAREQARADLTKENEPAPTEEAINQRANEIGWEFNRQVESRNAEWCNANRSIVDNVSRVNMVEAARSQYLPPSCKENADIEPTTRDIPGLITDLLAKNDGLAIGEVHTFDDSYRLISDNMATFKKAGVDTLYLEIRDESLEEYRALSSDELRQLARNRQYKDITVRSPQQVASNYNLRKSDDVDPAWYEMMATAKDHGIRLIGMDQYDGFSDLRISTCNFTWTDNIKADRKWLEEQGQGGGKYIVLGGNNHFTNKHYAYDMHRIGLVDDALGIPTIMPDKMAYNAQPPFERGRSANGPDFYVAGGLDYAPTKTQTQQADAYELSMFLRKLRIHHRVDPYIMAMSDRAWDKAREMEHEYLWDMNRVYSPEEIAPGENVRPAATPTTAKNDEAKKR
ncbi:MAG: hypothetical protein AB7L92_02200 [Alphaproteobacteria bacterium]